MLKNQILYQWGFGSDPSLKETVGAAAFSNKSICRATSIDNLKTFLLHLVSRIEKKRTVIPAMLEALQNHNSADVNLDYFYRLLFTRENLKLVHIVCHKKGAHNLLCDTKEIFRQASDTGNRKQKAKGKKRRLPWIFLLVLWKWSVFFHLTSFITLIFSVNSSKFRSTFTSLIYFWTGAACRALIDWQPFIRHWNKPWNHEKHLFVVCVCTMM